MEKQSIPLFENTETAFKYKSDNDLSRANLIFTIVNHPWISSLATGLVEFGLKLKLPIDFLIRKTAFRHFCGGESIEESEDTIKKLGDFNVGTILDYSAEGEKSEDGFESTCNKILDTFDKAKNSKHIPFCVFKATGMADSTLLEKINSRKELTQNEKLAFERIRTRVDRICRKAYDYSVPILIDAEETWIQDPIDALVYEMMGKYNKEKPIVYNTFQMYRKDMLDHLKMAFEQATDGNYYLGVKMVRGAYMEKERDRAFEMNYPDPIQPDKKATDDAFDKGLEFCVENRNRVSLVCGSHNEYSNWLLTQMMAANQMQVNDEHVWFSQLLGMSDNISFNLAREGYNVVKYVPFGPIKSVMPYLLRRAEENTSIAGQSSRELRLIRKEIKRRKGKG